MKLGVVNKSTAVNRFVGHTLQRNITHLAVITRRTNIKLGILKRGELEKSRYFLKFIKWKSFQNDFYIINCIKTCRREQVNKFRYFSHAKCRVSNFWTVLFHNFSRGMENWKRAKFSYFWARSPSKIVLSSAKSTLEKN